ncbi:MAG: ABC transporter ATP-binding protein [Chloroflexi bacterium]|nr:ABC transporter ATP-binding protein [Chloroflexota bacterium]
MLQSPGVPTAAPAAPVLEAMGASKRYRRGGSWALRDVDLSIAPGTITALVGPNGAGKSTIIRSWIGFEGLTGGSVRVMGIDPQTDRAGAVNNIGYVSQSTALYRGLTVGDHLALAGTLRHGFDADAAEERLDQLAIPLSQKAGSLSGGQAAQVALCIALGTRAPVLLLDEPLASLDPLARHDFLNLLVSAVRERGATALLSSHIVSDVQAACDHLVVLGNGRVTLQAPIAQAVEEHRLMPVGSAPAGSLVADFARPGGGTIALVRSSDPAFPAPTLEELVMGYLSAAKQRPGAGERPADRTTA